MKFVIASALVLCAFSAKAESLVKIDGSSTVFPVTEAVSEEFQTVSKGATKVTVGVSGTGGGFKKFCRGETDIQNASRPITKEEMKACRDGKITYFELPIAFDAIAIVVNPKNNWVSEITTEELKKMWEPAAQGKIMTWKQVNAKWPDEKLTLFGASTDNGTFDYFTEAIVEKSKSSRGDYTASVDHNTRVTGVNGVKGGLGYIPYAYYVTNKDKLKLLGVIGGAKSPAKHKAVLPEEKTVISGQYYPLSRPIFIYVSQTAMTRPEVKQYVEFYLEKGAEMAKQVQYIPLPAKAYTTAKEHLSKKKTGTVFAGEPHVGLTIEQILKKEATL
ncbi:PstS family phosphate ABC transporter substrate-binding protein [Bdellovibrio sp. SKB1291214]|uniref:PstS family phosphate ABC transporter substrate-binding protein n=1 Tax=Bdellovibrio sp. SKB1291214 TaxID=1732569 RepID=UPI000B5199E9|nr:PstS family phosphate ABC transporter substrate-binding protein [Bdellovibrio sp. SKB1291214]UYL09701.1 PstS family phosphate ABC transporter substrate-binding protein [Bdellovibrio sp. SKB1291214]